MNIGAGNGAPELTAGLSIIHSNHLEDLRQVAVRWICSHPLKPLENEIFLVQSNGMAQWLKLAMAANDGCGISAAIDFQLPARFLWSAYRTVLGEEETPYESAYDRERLTWRLLKLLPCLLEDDRFAPLKQFLADDDDLRKRYQLACYLADLYDQYQVYRADWLEDWAMGQDRWRNATGRVAPLPAGQSWQAELWRRIQADMRQPQRGTSRAELHQRFLQTLAALSTRPTGLPRRIIVFGICSMPKQTLEALQALSRCCQVLMFVHNPCRHYWADIIEDRELLRIETARHRRKAQVPADLDPEFLHQHVNPLLAAWGKQGRDYIGLLYGYDRPDAYRQNFAEIDLFQDFVAPDQAGHLLQQVQQAILDLQPLPAAGQEKPSVAPDDRSISFQLAHSRQREVEILQDQLLACFEQFPDLKPRDIIVMMPDIRAYAPHIEAVFGNLPPEDERYIPFTIADQPERASLPVLAALEKLLHLPDLRITVGDIMDLLEVPALRDRFALAEADLPRLHSWIEGAGIRWGLSSDHRQSFDLPSGLEQNTWLFGLRRMLLGYAVGTSVPWRQIAPYDEIGGLEAALVGPLAAMLEQLEKYWQLLLNPATADEWCQRILDLSKAFFTPAGSRDQLTLRRLEEVLDQWLNACTDAELDGPLILPVVRSAILSALTDASISQRFLAGMVNFGTLMPMRAIPFKVVCLLGMNDGEYPRSRLAPDFDLMAAPGHYRPGDRSRREDDRYLFLEALLSAREKLYISYIGKSVRDNSPCVPSVLVGQLRDYLASGWAAAGDPESGDRLLAQLTCQHPLQPFSRTYFQPARAPGLFTYAHEWRKIFDTAKEPKTTPSLGPPQFESRLTLEQLIRFLKKPVQSFFNQRLNVHFEDIPVTTLDQEPFVLDHLAPFGLGVKLLAAGLAADPKESAAAVEQAVQHMRLTGELPMHGFGERAAAELARPVEQMLAHYLRLRERFPHKARTVEIDLAVDLDNCGDTSLQDWLTDLYQVDPADAPSPSESYARWHFYPHTTLDKKGQFFRLDSLIPPWVHHLAGCAQGLHLTSYLVAPDGLVGLPPLDREPARQMIQTIIANWWSGLQDPLPVAAKTALAYLRAEPDADPEKAVRAARNAYQGNAYNFSGELGYSPYLKRVYPDFEAIWQAEDNRFTVLAEALYAPMVQSYMQEH
ncbi:RecBCD enzyme subunit RecC [Desulfosarcina ovata subsp. sediminis]|uniref:RecBCD enzyme subunit RecC n=1 Tax=Desulfosarcina ovata subsp. sediminis TaxID=885957 RepID=A0A5K7ZHE6_9BACT|nr:exodeoxyribonuclease V subunit gamma [Desulfosarcina ovata]BBO80406.1 RecBCD enzyme subunit RecC [Desulfosarcina ovata subsp. sediminis]